MPKKIAAAAVPLLQLTADDEAALQSLSTKLEHELLSQYEEFLFRDQRIMDATRWKHMKSDGDVHAYKERHTKNRVRPDEKQTRNCGPQQALADQSVIPRVLITGTIPGTLDDVMYGSSFQDTPSLQRFWTIHGDRIDESAVLAKVDGVESIDDPYQFLGVIWFLRSFPFNIIQRRDFLGLSSSRLGQLSTGERVGIMVGHSIQHRDLAEFHEFQTIRATSSILKIYRQLDGNRVELFLNHFLDNKGSVTDSSHVKESVTYLVPSAAALCEMGFRKKLEYLVRRRERDHLDSTPCDAIEPKSSGTNEHCELCDKRLGTLFTPAGGACQLCYQHICSRCSVSYDLAVTTKSKHTKLRTHTFCTMCIVQARALPTLKAAQDDVQHRYSSVYSKSSRDRALTTLVSSDLLLNTKG